MYISRSEQLTGNTLPGFKLHLWIKGQCVGITGSAYVICGASGKCLAIRRKADIDYLHRYNRTVIKHYLQTILSTNGQCRSNMQTVVRAVS